MQSQQALIGTTVRVNEGHRMPELEGMCGIIEKIWGDPNYPAVDVRLENGRSELFWFYQLDTVDEAMPVTYYDGS